MTTAVDVDILLENLMQLMTCNNKLILSEKDQFKFLYEELGFLRKFFIDDDDDDAEYDDDEYGKVKDLVSLQIRSVAYEAENIIDFFVYNALIIEQRRISEKKIGHVILRPLNLSGVMDEIKSLKRVVMDIYEKNIYNDIGVLQIGTSSLRVPSIANNTIVEEETVVGFDDNATAIIERLIGFQKRLNVVSIVGMAGIGKTTLAKKVYNDPFVLYHFNIRAWTCVSQVYTKKDLLLNILDSALFLKDDDYKLMDEMLAEQLYKRLKGRRYLIVLDDIWNIGAWNDLKRCFPDDRNGSRIMFTSRLTDVALHAKPDSIPYSVGFLTQRDSWDLLKLKVFEKESCPTELEVIGKNIVEKCRGLPLALVAVAGILKKKMTIEWWMRVAKRVSSYICGDTEQCLNILELSYNHLPHHLKACFLYFGAFPEDCIIHVQLLILLWVAEGFIRKNEQKSLEEVAEDYLVDLIDRSLVIVSKKSSNGGIKACQVHDLFRDLCLRKAQEENFLHQISGCSVASRRLCIHSDIDGLTFSKLDTPHLRSFLYIGTHSEPIFWRNSSVVYQAFILIRVLNFLSVRCFSIPEEIYQLVHLRYLALCVWQWYFKPNIFNLCNLETFHLDSGRLELADDIWKMSKLRHLNIQQTFRLPCLPYDFSTFELQNLQTIGYLDLLGGTRNEQVLSSIPNLRKLKCNCFPDLGFLIHLKILKIRCEYETPLLRFPSLAKFPPSLKKLTLLNSCLPWNEISTLGILPHLEILKLLGKSFKGQSWDTSDWQFRKLKFLKFKGLDIVEWNASSNHFPNLLRLVVQNCFKLKEIPFGLGDIFTLEMIELWGPSESAANSARKIQEHQLSMDNHGLQILIHQDYLRLPRDTFQGQGLKLFTAKNKPLRVSPLLPPPPSSKKPGNADAPMVNYGDIYTSPRSYGSPGYAPASIPGHKNNSNSIPLPRFALLYPVTLPPLSSKHNRRQQSFEQTQNHSVSGNASRPSIGSDSSYDSLLGQTKSLSLYPSTPTKQEKSEDTFQRSC